MLCNDGRVPDEVLRRSAFPQRAVNALLKPMCVNGLWKAIERPFEGSKKPFEGCSKVFIRIRS